MKILLKKSKQGVPCNPLIVYYFQIFNKKKEHIIINSRVISSHVVPMYRDTLCVCLSLSLSIYIYIYIYIYTNLTQICIPIIDT